MTEEEAKKKWCPFARVGSEMSGLGSLNRDQQKGVLPENLCIASACMAWRQTHIERGPIVERRRAEPLSTRPAGDDWGYEAVDPSLAAEGGDWVRWDAGTPHGYCGLSGPVQ